MSNPTDHSMEAMQQAAMLGISLNQLVQKAIEKVVTHKDMPKTRIRKRANVA